MKIFSKQISLRNRIVGDLLYLIQRFTHYTGRVQYHGLEHWQRLQEEDQPVITTAWHSMNLLILSATLRLANPKKKTFVIMPDDWRGESLFHFIKKIGLEPSPMDLETKGISTARQLAQIVRQIKKGNDAHIAPDGPAGPLHIVKPGASFIAQKTRAAILPLAAYTSHRYNLPRWDRHVVPLPFSRITVSIGAPIYVQNHMNLESVNEQIRNALNQITSQATTDFYQSK